MMSRNGYRERLFDSVKKVRDVKNFLEENGGSAGLSGIGMRTISCFHEENSSDCRYCGVWFRKNLEIVHRIVEIICYTYFIRERCTKPVWSKDRAVP